MHVEIRKIGFTNKGAELMLLAVLERMQGRYPSAVFTAATTHRAGERPFHKVVGCGMYPKFSHHLLGRDMGGDLMGLLPRRARERYGLIVESEIDVVIDASGYLYGDPFSPRRVTELARAAARWKRQGKKLVLMPQAFGPFSRRETQRAMRRIVELADLVMPRDPLSLGYIRELAGGPANVAMYPDFTPLVQGELPESFDSERYRAAVIPNAQMIAKTQPREGSRYIPFMQAALAHLVERSQAPFILIHESDRDRELADRIREPHPKVPVVPIDSAKAIKGVIGECRVTIGSRFHGLISALSQGVPSLATGWSHKYDELFKEYGCPEQVLGLDTDESGLQHAIDALVDEATYDERRACLLEHAAKVRDRIEAMWERIFAAIEK